MAAVASSSPPAAILGPQPTWVPYEPTRDCSQGLCSMYCPQWCYFIFPPPPPPAFDLGGPGSDDSSGPTFSPLVIAIIGVLASAFLLVSYYTIISKYCGTFTSLWNWLFGSGGRGRGHGGGGGDGGGSRSQEPWSAAPPDGLDETLINKITVCKYQRGDGFVDSTDCSVCLGEFRDGESLRLLPKCSHAFHLPCIDTWLKSHSNCPLCRCNIAFVATVGVVSPEPERRPTREDHRRDNLELVLTVDDSSEQARDEPRSQNAASGGAGAGQEAPKDCPGRSEEASSIVEIKEDGAPAARASSSLSDTHREGRMSIADVLQASMEDELMMARESGLLAGSSGSSRRCHGEHSNKDGGGGGGRSGRAMPDAAKRLPSVGRSCFSSRSGRGKDSVLPM